jgi:hypothetical protein
MPDYYLKLTDRAVELDLGAVFDDVAYQTIFETVVEPLDGEMSEDDFYHRHDGLQLFANLEMPASCASNFEDYEYEKARVVKFLTDRVMGPYFLEIGTPVDEDTPPALRLFIGQHKDSKIFREAFPEWRRDKAVEYVNVQNVRARYAIGEAFECVRLALWVQGLVTGQHKHNAPCYVSDPKVFLH